MLKMIGMGMALYRLMQTTESMALRKEAADRSKKRLAMAEERHEIAMKKKVKANVKKAMKDV